MYDIEKYKKIMVQGSRYERHVKRMQARGMSAEFVKDTVYKATDNIKAGKSSYVIFGEPQSGKTEMMIALNAKLLDEGYKTIVVLLNDSMQLLNQNLERFRLSDIDPTPTDISEIVGETIGDKKWIIFCKKNINDLKRLNILLYKKHNIVVIDDEADFASPNSKINKDMRTAINSEIFQLLGGDGLYIGVTATPARLDMNNTFDNMTEDWIYFQPHKEYVGKDIFFPLNFKQTKYTINWLPVSGDSPASLENALISFLVNVSYINIFDSNVKNKLKRNYEEIAKFSFLIHTSGRTADHTKDEHIVNKFFDSLSNTENKNFERLVKNLLRVAASRFGAEKADPIVEFILTNIRQKLTSVLNAQAHAKKKIASDLTNPPALFTVIIGGNIISRGVTFNNLLSMFFTRDVKHKMQQDTYIQRARMFGNRNIYLKYFELWIPKQLYLDWHKCFVYHQLSLEAIMADGKAPVWISDDRVNPVAPGSIDKKSVVTDAGEMYFSKFTPMDGIINLQQLLDNPSISDIDKLKAITEKFGNTVFPQYVIKFIESQLKPYEGYIAVHPLRNVGKETDYHDSLYRPRGVIGGEDTKRYPNAVHHILVQANTNGEARIIYKYEGKITFLRNLKGVNV